MSAWLDEAPSSELAARLAPLFEDAPRFIARLVAGRPYGSWERLFEAAGAVALALPEEERIELIDAHPRIGAPPETVSALSFQEQGYGLPPSDGAAPEQQRAGGERHRAEAEREPLQSELDRLNEAYEARFGFRYVVFVAGRPRSAIVPLMTAALEGDREAEMARALRDIVAIARDRAAKLGLADGETARTEAGPRGAASSVGRAAAAPERAPGGEHAAAHDEEGFG